MGEYWEKVKGNNFTYIVHMEYIQSVWPFCKKHAKKEFEQSVNYELNYIEISISKKYVYIISKVQ